MPSALVILEEVLDKNPRELAGPLAKALGRVRYDVIGALKRNPYIPFKDLTFQAAEAGASCLAGVGVTAAIVDAGRLPPAPKVFTVHNARVEADGLAVQTDLVGRLRTVPWDGIEALSAATVSETSTAVGLDGGALREEVRMAREAIHDGMGQLIQPEMPGPLSRTDVYTVLCLLPRGADVEMRFRADQFNYDYLGERISTISSENFRIFAGDVLTRARGALVDPRARSLVETGEAPPVLDKKRLADYNLWLRLRAREGL